MKMVQTRSHHVEENLETPENIIPLIQTTNNNDQNPEGGLAHDQHASGTQVLHGAGHSYDHTHTTSLFDSNYIDSP